MEYRPTYTNKGEEAWLNTVSQWLWLPSMIRMTIAGAISYGFSLYYMYKGSISNPEEKLDQLIKSFPNTTGRKKVAIVTGANSGIGYETARVLAKAGYKVIIACRDKTKAGKAINDIQDSMESECDVEFLKLDLLSLESVRQFAKEFLKKGFSLDLLVNNAGIMLLPECQITGDNFEAQYQVNYLSHFLLTVLLAPKLKSTSDSKVINLTSLAHYGGGNCDFSKVNEKAAYNPFDSYALAKAAVVMSSYSFQEKLSSFGVQVFAVHPGIVATDLFRHLPFGNSLLKNITPYLAKSPLQGALTTLRIALTPSEMYKNYKSRYFADEIHMIPLLATRSPEKREALWNSTFKELNIDCEL